MLFYVLCHNTQLTSVAVFIFPAIVGRMKQLFGGWRKQRTKICITAKQKHKQKKNSISTESGAKAGVYKIIMKKARFDTQQIACNGSAATNAILLFSIHKTFSIICSSCIRWRKGEKAPILGKCALFIILCGCVSLWGSRCCLPAWLSRHTERARRRNFRNNSNKNCFRWCCHAKSFSKWRLLQISLGIQRCLLSHVAKEETKGCCVLF